MLMVGVNIQWIIKWKWIICHTYVKNYDEDETIVVLTLTFPEHKLGTVNLHGQINDPCEHFAQNTEQYFMSSKM